MSDNALSKQMRIDILRMINRANTSHIAAAFSIVEMLAVLYSGGANIAPETVHDANRDRIILSKGHAGAALYAVLAEKGFFNKAELDTYNQNDSRLSGHILHTGVPGIELSTGSLGHGLPVACGMALTGLMDQKDYRVFCICGDGECDEGTTWETALFAAHYQVENLTLIVDHNKMQSLDFCKNTMCLEPFADKWRSFGWDVQEIDGHDCQGIRAALLNAAACKGKPSVIIANTVKGKGVSWMENDILWHYRAPQNGDEYDQAYQELTASPKEGDAHA